MYDYVKAFWATAKSLVQMRYGARFQLHSSVRESLTLAALGSTYWYSLVDALDLDYALRRLSRDTLVQFFLGAYEKSLPSSYVHHSKHGRIGMASLLK